MPADQPARNAITGDLDETMFVEAGAGAGKTTCLVDRIVALVEDGTPIDTIAAITFTERAAAELVDRIRKALHDKAAAGSDLCREALGDLDRAAISTLHAFAQRLINEFPLEAGLPPRITVLDEIASDIAFVARWRAWVQATLDDPAAERPVRLLLAAGGRLDHLRQVARAFADNWDLLDGRTLPPAPAVPPLDVSTVLARVDAVVRHRNDCDDPADTLVRFLDEWAQWATALRACPDDDGRLGKLCAPPSWKAGGKGRKGNWTAVPVATVRDAVSGLEDVIQAPRLAAQRACLDAMAERLAAFTVAGAHARRSAGELEFHDLLVLARSVLRDPQHGLAVRAAAAVRYHKILLDEFQDTDPIQIEIAVLLASSDPAAGTKPWEKVAVEPGRLFVVGDPKQSIYRFRRADIGVFLTSREAIGATVHQLTANFRTVSPILDWVNHTFGTLIVETEGAQPAYVPLDATRTETHHGPAVSLLGAAEHPRAIKADDLRDVEAAAVAAAVATVVGDGWQVGAEGAQRPARWDDIAILLPARTSLRSLERALERANVPYRVETSSLVYGTGEVRDLLMVARAVDDPTDELALVAALRCAAFGCGDDDLYEWRRRHGRWDHQAAAPPDLPPEHPVAEAMAWIGALHRERTWLAASEVLARIVRDRRLMEVAFVQPRPRDLWRRLRFVVDQCRAWEEAGGTSLRGYLEWVRLQSAEGARVVETVLPETDDRAVRILTVHGAKGLEFPVTVLSGMTTALRARSNGVQVIWPPGGGWAFKLKGDLATAEFETAAPIEEQMDRHERLRLLYVAATRACDHLVVSVHRKEGASDTAAGVLWAASRSAPGADELTPDPALVAPAATDDHAAPTVALPSIAEWEAAHLDALARSSRPMAVSATLLAEEAARRAEDEELAGLKKDARDLDLPPWQKGRYGSAVGRAVHAVLQTVDLITGAGLDAACAAAAAAEGVSSREAVIGRFCRSALASEIVVEAAGSPHWRELYVGVPLDDDTVLEGYIDLLYRRSDGLVVVDYKTDRWDTPAQLDDKVERYRVQLGAYRRAVADATGEPVMATVLLFLSASGDARAVEVDTVAVV